MIIKIKNFIVSLINHIKNGLPKSSLATIQARYNICENCSSFDSVNSQCLECGCNLSKKREFLNKLAWQDQKCPLNKW